MSLAQDIYIQFVDHFSALSDSSLLQYAKQKNEQLSHHHHSLLLALNDVLKARGL